MRFRSVMSTPVMRKRRRSSISGSGVHVHATESGRPSFVTHVLSCSFDCSPAATASMSAFTSSVSDEVESELRCADGSVRAFLWTAVPVADVTGRSTSLVLLSGIEVTERRRLEVEKERERAFLNAIANNAPSMLCLVDVNGHLTEGGANIAFEQTLGYEPAEIGGQVLWEDFVDPSETDEVKALIEAVVDLRQRCARPCLSLIHI